MRRVFTCPVCLLLVVSFVSGCAGVNQSPKAGVERAPVAAPVPVGPPRGHVVDVKQFLPVRDSASLSAKQVGRLEPEAAVTVLDENAEWYRVSGTTKKGKNVEGWVLQKHIEKETPVEVAAVPQGNSQENIEQMKDRTKKEGLLTGAGIGALAGIAVAVATGDAKNAATYAAVGAAIGGGVGYLTGSYVADKKGDYANAEDYLDACIAEADQYNQDAQRYNQNLEESILLTQRNIEKIRSDMTDATQRKQKIQEQTAGLQKTCKDCDTMIARLEGELKAQEKALKNSEGDKTGKLATLEKQVGNLRTNLDGLKAKRNQLNDMTNAQNQMG